jgi:hypothetical protein
MKQSTSSVLSLGSDVRNVEHEILGRRINDIGLTIPERMYTARHRNILRRAQEILDTVQESTGIAEFGDAEDFLKTLNCDCCNDGEEAFVRVLR